MHDLDAAAHGPPRWRRLSPQPLLDKACPGGPLHRCPPPVDRLQVFDLLQAHSSCMCGLRCLQLMCQ